MAATPTWLAACYFVAAAGTGWVFPAFATQAANTVEGHEQGAAAGSVGAAQGLGIVSGRLAGTLLYGFWAGVPYLLVARLLTGVALWPVPKVSAQSQVGCGRAPAGKCGSHEAVVEAHDTLPEYVDGPTRRNVIDRPSRRHCADINGRATQVAQSSRRACPTPGTCNHLGGRHLAA
jgi:hypothetical protein